MSSQEHDYDLTKLKEIHFRGLRYNIMPRYEYHYLGQDYEKFSLDFLNRLISKGSTFVDIGAHYGAYSLLAAKKAGKVFAFEPVPENYEILKRNIDVNKLDNVIAINKAVSDKVENVEFNIPWASDSAGFYAHPNADTIRKIQVKTAMIDEEINDKNISLIKIDTEGHEIHVLAGLKKTLKNNKQAKLLIEFNPKCLINAGFNSEDLIDTIHKLGFDILALHENERHIVKIEASTPIDQFLKGKEYLNLLCIPKGEWAGILFISHSASIGGAELALWELVQHIDDYKEKFLVPYVVVPGTGELLDRFKEAPVALLETPYRGWVEHQNVSAKDRMNINAVNVQTLAHLSRIIKDFKPVTIFSNTLVIPWGSIVASGYNVPHVTAVHEFGDLDHKLMFDYGYQDSLKILNYGTDHFIVNSKAVQQYITRTIPKKKTTQLYFNIEDSKQALSAKQQGVFKNDKALKLAIIGKVTASKGQLDALKALQSLQQQGVKSELLIVGDIQDKAYLYQLKKFIKLYSLEDTVHIVGYKPNPQDFMSQADIVLMCSENEAFGRVTVEAMYLEKPVVGSASGGTPEIISQGKTGYLYKPHDIDDLVAQIKQLNDIKTRRTFGLAARKLALERFNNSYYQDVYTLLATLKVTKRTDVQAISKDLLEGSMYLNETAQDNLSQLQEQYNRDIAHFSEKYNEVYAEYNKLRKKLDEQYSQKAKHAASRIIGKLKQARKT